MSLDTSDKISILSIIATTLISLSSVVIALIALKVTKKSILEANRPYIVIYIETIDIGFYNKYLVIKNFGVSGATINNVKCDQTFSDELLNNFISDLAHRFIAPGQSFVTSLDIEATEVNATFEISYSNESSKYKESFHLNANAFKYHAHMSTDDALTSSIHAFKKSQF